MEKSLNVIFANILMKKELSLAIAESCTGGLIAAKLTEVPGISPHFDRGFVTYSNNSKIQMLGVNEKTIEIYGAVSKEIATEMARGAMKNSNADIALAVTGIAGPDGGTEEKPVGTVFIAVATKEIVTCERFNLAGTRNAIREKASDTAFGMLIRSVSKKYPQR